VVFDAPAVAVRELEGSARCIVAHRRVLLGLRALAARADSRRGAPDAYQSSSIVALAWIET
jgi:hypothetical protein